jgi:hypothetical protein
MYIIVILEVIIWNKKQTNQNKIPLGTFRHNFDGFLIFHLNYLLGQET